ncbi:MAG: DNA repair protein RecO [Pseudomonadota bacterium]
MQTELQPAYILHTRPYRDTSMLVDFLTPQFGRFTAVARGVRSRKTLKRNLLNPFTCLLISFQGKADLKLLTHFEAGAMSFSLTEKYLFSGFYLNELIMRLLPSGDAHQEIFYLYQEALDCLHERWEIESVLRKFEISLLASLGYAIDFHADAKSGLAITSEQFYCLDVQQGFFLADANTPPSCQICGEHILAIVGHHYQDLAVRQTAKRITRSLLKPLLGSKPLVSRKLFI